MRPFLLSIFLIIGFSGFSQQLIVNIWNDTNNDNVYSAAEGLASVPFILTDTGSGATQPVNSNANGRISLNPLNAGNYTIQIDPVWLADNPQYDSATATQVVSFTMPPLVGSRITVNFQLCAATIDGLVFNDLNQDGVQDPGEEGLGGWPVMVTDAQGNVINIVTNPDGTYETPFPIPDGDTTAEVTVSVPPTSSGDSWSATTLNPISQTLVCGDAAIQTGFINATALPIELTAFNVEAVNNDVHVSWTTASELNNDFVAIEYSVDGINFTEAGRVDGHGSTKEVHHYNFTHENAITTLGGLVYYRLTQHDFGDFAPKYSKIKVASFDTGNVTESKVFPNPAPAGSTIAIQSEDNVRMLSILDINGQVVKEIEFTSDSKFETVPTSGLSRGIYFIRINGAKTQKLVVN